jgi:hypothetical protein
LCPSRCWRKPDFEAPDEGAPSVDGLEQALVATEDAYGLVAKYQCH